MATNALIMSAVAAVSSFVHRVDLPVELIPKATDVVNIAQSDGHLNLPVIHIVHRNGTEFWIEGGSVRKFETTNSFFSEQNPGRITNYFGESALTPEGIRALGAQKLSRLAPSDWKVEPVIKKAPDYGTNAIPFYELAWPSGNTMNKFAARMEIDARSGRICGLDLIDRRIFPLAQPGVSQRPIEKSRKPFASSLPRPSTNEVSVALRNLSLVFMKLGFQPRAPYTPADVDWEGSIIARTAANKNDRVAYIRLIDGSAFTAVDGRVYSFTSSDAYITADSELRNDEENRRFQGTVLVDWEKSAASFEKRLEKEFGFSREFLSRFSPAQTFKSARPGETGLLRAQVMWFDVSGTQDKTLAGKFYSNLPEGWMVEFELRTGAPVSFGMRSIDSKNRLLRAQKPK